MKLFDSTKKKVIAGVTAFALVSGVGVSFAATDLGTQLKTWYDGVFNESVEQAQGEATKYGKEKLPELYQEYNGIKNGAKDDINKAGEGEINQSSSKIDKAKESHISDLEEAKEELLAEAGPKFHAVYQESFLEIKRLAEVGQEHAKNDLKALTDKVGSDAVTNVNSKLDEAKNDAVSELEKAVADAKEELQDKLDYESEALSRNLKNQINFSIGDLREEVNKIASNFVKAQETAIADAASNKVEEAKSALDGVVVGE